MKPISLLPLVCAAIALVAGCGRSGGQAPVRTAESAAPRSPALTAARTNAPAPKTPGIAATRVTSAFQRGADSWVRFGYDPQRGGVNPRERRINRSSVGRLHQLWRVELPGLGDSSPVTLSGLRFPDGAIRDVLYMTTTQGQLVAVDAASGKILWTRSQKGDSKLTKSSPVVDPVNRTVYSYGLDGYLHKYDAVSGDEDERGGWPVRITRMPVTEKESSSLNISKGWIFVTTSGYLGDAPPYQGHIVAINEATGSSNVFNSLCSRKRYLLAEGDCDTQLAGIWARAGVVVDPETNSIYAVSGNGLFDANKGGDNYGDTILKLGTKATRLKDSYTPENYQQLDDQDQDLSSTAPALLPRIAHSQTPLLMVQGGKDGTLRLINRQDLSGKGGPGHVGGEVQSLESAGCDTFTQPAVWQDDSGKVWVFVAGTCGFAAYNPVTDKSGNTRLKLAWKGDEDTTSPVIASGVIFAASNGKLLALDPATGEQLWSGGIGDVHWESPIVVGGRVYVADESGYLYAFGLG